MTPRQRFLAAIRHQPVDRLPFAARNLHPFPFGGHGKHPEYHCLFDAIRRTGATMLSTVYLPHTDWLPPVQWSEHTEADGVKVAIETLPTPLGDLRRVRRQPPGQPGMIVEHFLKDEQDIRRFQSIRHQPVTWNPATLANCDVVGDAGLAMMPYDDPFSTVSGLFESEDFAIRLMSEPEPILQLIEPACQRAERNLRTLLEAMRHGRHEALFLCHGPELATPPLFSPKVLAQVVTPFETRLVKLIHEYDYPVCVHCHGRIRHALPEFIRCGFDVTEPCEPPPQGDIDLKELRQAAGGKIALMGYVQDQDLHWRTPDYVRQHVQSIVNEVGHSSGFVAATTCTPFQYPPTETWVKNYAAFLEAAAELGA